MLRCGGGDHVLSGCCHPLALPSDEDPNNRSLRNCDVTTVFVQRPERIKVLSGLMMVLLELINAMISDMGSAVVRLFG